MLSVSSLDFPYQERQILSNIFALNNQKNERMIEKLRKFVKCFKEETKKKKTKIKSESFHSPAACGMM